MYPLPTPLPGIALHPLGAAHRDLIVAHLQRLDSDDRGLRFAQASITNAAIARYVDAIPLRHDALVGAFGPWGPGMPDQAPMLIALGHGCLFDGPRGRMVEGAFSVDEAWRGRGIGHALLAALQVFARDAGAMALVGQCAARNWRMRRVFEAGGMALQREDDEIQARRWLREMPAGGVAGWHLDMSRRSGKLAARHFA